MKSGLVWILNGQKEVGLQMVRHSNGIWNPEDQPFEIGTMATILSKTIWNPDKQPNFDYWGNLSYPYQYTKVFQCDMSTFIYTNKFNQ